MTATITDMEEFRAWRRAKHAWQSANPHPSLSWEKLSEEERLKWKRAFERDWRRR